MNVTCDVFGDYHVIDTGNGYYQVWYVNPHDDNDEYVSRHETLYEAKMNAICASSVDLSLAARNDA